MSAAAGGSHATARVGTIQACCQRRCKVVPVYQTARGACSAHFRLPIGQRWAICKTNLLKGLFVEERRRWKIISNALG